MDLFIHYGMAAGLQAWREAALQVTAENAERIGVNFGSGIGGLPLIESMHDELKASGPRRISPFFIPGSIINITSVVGASGNPGQANYAAAKAAVVGMTKSLARELGSRNITVNCVAPGFIDTDMTRALSEEQRKSLLAQIPLGRLGTPQDVAAAVAYLASPAGSYVTGAVLHVNGGMYMS